MVNELAIQVHEMEMRMDYWQLTTIHLPLISKQALVATSVIYGEGKRNFVRKS